MYCSFFFFFFFEFRKNADCKGIFIMNIKPLPTWPYRFFKKEFVKNYIKLIWFKFVCAFQNQNRLEVLFFNKINFGWYKNRIYRFSRAGYAPFFYIPDNKNPYLRTFHPAQLTRSCFAPLQYSLVPHVCKMLHTFCTGRLFCTLQRQIN